MATYRHPSELNPWQRFKQANRILQKTTRASNPAWYKEALTLNFQVHLRMDGSRFQCQIHDKAQGSWSQGPAFDDGLVSEPEKAVAFIEKLLELAWNAKAKALGIVIHYAEDFATTELRSGVGTRDSLLSLRTEIEREPKSVLADNSASIEETSWRLIPYLADESAAIATAVGVTRRWAPVLDIFRQAGVDHNFPVITQTLNAPLVSLLSLAEMKKDALTRPVIALAPFSRFTLIAFLNAQGDLILLRSFQHRSQRVPGNLRQILTATAASLELTDPEVHLLATDLEGEQRVLEELGFATTFPGLAQQADTGIIRHSALPGGQPSGLPLEFRLVTTLDIAPGTPLGESRTFTSLRTQGWLTQDFLPVPVLVRELYPDRAEMQLIRGARFLRRFLFVVGVGVLLYCSKNFIHMFNQPEFSYREEDAKALQMRQMALNFQRTKIEYWDNLLADRSKAWSVMEVMPRLAKGDGDMLLKGVSYTATPVNMPGQPKLGIVKVWKISGFGREKGLAKLTKESIAEIFNQIAKEGEGAADSFALNVPTRVLEVSVKSQENTSYLQGPNNDTSMREESFPYLFELTITQKFDPADPFALNTAKAP